MIITSKQTFEYTKGYANTPHVRSLIEQETAICTKANRKPDSSITNLYLCHATRFLPREGIIHPRMKFNGNTTPGLIPTIERVFSIFRPTVHFSVNSIASAHSAYAQASKPRFIIIDKLTNALDSISGGYLEDMFCIGPYRISNEATILIPESSKMDSELQDKIKKLNGRVEIVYYNGSEQLAFENWIQGKNAHPIKAVQSDPNIPNFVCLLGNDRYISSQSLMQEIKKTFCTHDTSPTAQIEEQICTGEIYSIPPFLESVKTHSLEVIVRSIIEYVDVASKVYELSAKQRRFIRSYEEAILLAVKIISKAKNNVQLLQDLDFHNELIMHYDKKFDLTRKIDSQSATQVLSELTGLTFSAYYRMDCDTIVDAAHQTSLSEIESETLLAKLIRDIGLEFTIEQQENSFYIILKGVNLPEVQEKIKK
ncbi:MAG: hypothetical protein HKM07_08570 [Chlamydiae bacterium]|nr:hypothetical protein [Chlamydiota bacterium]